MTASCPQIDACDEVITLRKWHTSLGDVISAFAFSS